MVSKFILPNLSKDSDSVMVRKYCERYELKHRNGIKLDSVLTFNIDGLQIGCENNCNSSASSIDIIIILITLRIDNFC